MRYGVPVARITRTTWRSDAREIAKALGIPVVPGQEWVTLESVESDGQAIDVIVWHPHEAAEYNTPEMIAGRDRGVK